MNKHDSISTNTYLQKLFKYKSAILILFILSYVVLIRIPQLSSNMLLPDQDECVLGMMANHFNKGQNFPLFFYGQHYGLSTVEVVLIATFTKVFGISVFSIKLPMLLLYMCSLVFLFLWSKNKLGLGFAFFITLLFASEPTWLTWAMKARGGYLSALLAGFYLLYSWQKEQKAAPFYMINAVIMGLLYHFQLLWFIAWLPLFFYYQRHLGLRKIIYASILVILTIVVFYILAQSTEAIWHKPTNQFNPNFNVSVWYNDFVVFLSGHFFFGYGYNLKYGTLIAVKLFLTIHVAVVVTAFHSVLKRRLFSEVTLWLLLLLFLLILPLWAFSGVFHFRYWLPCSVAFIGLAVVVCQQINWHKYKYALTLVVTVIAFFGYRAGKDITTMDIYSDWFPETNINREQQVRDLVQQLKSQNKKHILCNDINIMWLLNYYGNDAILSRWKINNDRHNTQVQQVNQHYLKSKKIDLLGAKFSFKDWQADSAVLQVSWLSSNFYLIENVDSAQLAKHNFVFMNN